MGRVEGGGEEVVELRLLISEGSEEEELKMRWKIS